MKKLVIGGLAAYGLYKILTKRISWSQAPVMTFDLQDTTVNPHLKNINSNPLVRWAVGKVPYSAFCEISGCKHEIHSTSEVSLNSAMQEHVRTAH